MGFDLEKNYPNIKEKLLNDESFKKYILDLIQENIENDKNKMLKSNESELQNRIEALKKQIEEKESEIESLKQSSKVIQKFVSDFINIFNISEQAKLKTELQKSEDKMCVIIEKIKSLFSKKSELESENSDLNNNLKEKKEEIDLKDNEISKLKIKNKDLEKDKSVKESRISELKSNNEDLERNLNERDFELKKIKNELESLKLKYLGISEKSAEVYKMFKSLSVQTRNNLENVFRTDDFLGFIADGMKKENIEALWNQTEFFIKEGKDKTEREYLRKLFLFFVERSYETRGFKIIGSEIIGSRYDGEKEYCKGKSDGIVKGILLEGYINDRGKIKAAWVELE